MHHAIRIIDKLLLGGAILASAATFALAVMLIIEVITTSFFNWSQPWAIEYSGYLLAVVMFAGSGWALNQNGHIRVSLLTSRLSPRARTGLEVVTTLMASGLAVFMAMVTTENAWRSFTIGSVSVYATRTPLIFPQGFLALSMMFLALGFINHLLKLLTRSSEIPAQGVVMATEVA